MDEENGPGHDPECVGQGTDEENGRGEEWIMARAKKKDVKRHGSEHVGPTGLTRAFNDVDEEALAASRLEDQ